MSWRERAACRGVDPELFFPKRGERVDAAKAYCQRCEVVQQCLDEAIAKPIDRVVGVWGGTSERERRRITSERYQRRMAS